MKNYIAIAALLAAGTAVANADSAEVGSSVMLDTKYQKGDVVGSIYEVRKEESLNDGIYTGELIPAAATCSFTIDVDELYSTTKFTGAEIFSLNSIEIVGNGYGWFTGGSRYVEIKCGEQTLTLKYPSASDAFSTLSVPVENVFSFAKTDTLTVTLTSSVADENVQLWYAAPLEGEGVTISGTEITDYTGKFAAIRLNATITAIPEPSAFGLLAGIGALALVASRRRRK